MLRFVEFSNLRYVGGQHSLSVADRYDIGLDSRYYFLTHLSMKIKCKTMGKSSMSMLNVEIDL